MLTNEFDDWYYRELDKAIRTPKRRGHLSRLRSWIRAKGVYRERTSVYAAAESTHPGGRASVDNSRGSDEALCRTRTGDPFLTMPPGIAWLMRGIALFLAVFWLSVGVLILTVFGGSDVL